MKSGELRIAEIVSRFSDADAFFSVLREIGFKLVNQVGISGPMKGYEEIFNLNSIF